jgi:hypothetical protein
MVNISGFQRTEDEIEIHISDNLFFSLSYYCVLNVSLKSARGRNLSKTAALYNLAEAGRSTCCAKRFGVRLSRGALFVLNHQLSRGVLHWLR